MHARHVAPLEQKALLDPDSPVWRSARSEVVRLAGTPLALQPTAAIQVAWSKKQIGAVDRVAVAALHDGAQLAFRLEWADATENREIVDTVAFPDAAAILLPSRAGAPLVSMGAPGLAVDAWYWRADEPRGREVTAEGIGTTRALASELVATSGVWKGGRWRVVIARALEVDAREPVAQLRPGATTQFAVAVWEGSKGERAGIKAYSVDWRALALGAAPTARS